MGFFAYEELIRRYRSGDLDALRELIERLYRDRLYYYLSAIPGTWKRIGEGECNAVFFSTLLSCVDNFRFGETSFRTYFLHAIRNNLFRLEVEILPPADHPTVSLDDPLDEEGGCPLAEFVPAEEKEDPRAYVNFVESLEKLEKIPCHLSEFDLKVAFLKIDGKSFTGIAKTLHCSVKKARVSHGRFLKAARKYLLEGTLEK
jgi:hypothetical protein